MSSHGEHGSSAYISLRQCPAARTPVEFESQFMRRAIDGAIALGPRMDYSHELRYRSLFIVGRSLVFPCDSEGHVPLDMLSKRALENYLYARAMVGREYAFPSVNASTQH